MKKKWNLRLMMWVSGSIWLLSWIGIARNLLLASYDALAPLKSAAAITGPAISWSWRFSDHSHTLFRDCANYFSCACYFKLDLTWIL